MENCELDDLMVSIRWPTSVFCDVWYIPSLEEEIAGSDQCSRELGEEWHPSADNAQALECLEAWKEAKEWGRATLDGFSRGLWTVRLFPTESDDYSFCCHADTLALAICTALAKWAQRGDADAKTLLCRQ